MSKLLRTTLAAMAALLLCAVAPPAWAAAPANDTPAGAIAVLLDAASEPLDTTEATSDATDAALLTQCGMSSVTDASVWYTYTPSVDGSFIVDAHESDYEVGLFIVAGDPTAGGELVRCDYYMVHVEGLAGTTYYIMAFDLIPGEPNGGTLMLSVSEPPPPPGVTVDPRGIAFKDGSAQISGTYTCEEAWDFDLYGRVTQQVGRLTLTGYIYLSSFYGPDELVCDGLPQPWRQLVSADNGLLAGGKATITMEYCDDWVGACVPLLEEVIQLSRAKLR